MVPNTLRFKLTPKSDYSKNDSKLRVVVVSELNGNFGIHLNITSYFARTYNKIIDFD